MLKTGVKPRGSMEVAGLPGLPVPLPVLPLGLRPERTAMAE